MTTKIKAHLDAGRVVLDEPIPKDFVEGQVYVILVNTDSPNAQEIAQSESGFAREVLMSTTENIWEND